MCKWQYRVNVLLQEQDEGRSSKYNIARFSLSEIPVPVP